MQICHSDAKVEIEDTVFKEDGLTISGNITLQALYTSSEDAKGFYPIRETVPFEITRQIEGLENADVEQYSLCAQTGSPSIAIKDSSQVEARITLSIHMIIYDTRQEDILTDLKIAPIDAAVLEKLPGFAIYYVKQGDSLWQIGKKYYVSVEQIKEINNLSSDEIKVGDKLLIVK